MKADDETFEDYLQRVKDRRTEDDYKYTDEDFIQYQEYIKDCYLTNLSVYKCLEWMSFAEKEIKAEDVFNDQKKEDIKKLKPNPLLMDEVGLWDFRRKEKTYSEEDMKSFGDWCRNGLLNTEYSVDRLDKHLEQWEQLKNK